MKLVDANLLLYAMDAASPQHRAARAWLEEQLSGTETVAFPWIVLLAFVRLSTKHEVFEEPLSVGEAFDVVEGWIERPCSTVVHPGGRHLAILRELLVPIGTAGNLSTDAHLAALSIEHGAELHSADRDFSRFSGLRWSNPLA